MARFVVALLGFVLLAGPVPQQPFVHPRLVVLTTVVQPGPNQPEGIEVIGFERDVGTTSGVVVYPPAGTSIRLDRPAGTVVGVPGVRLDVAGTTLAYNPFRTGLVVAEPKAYTNSTCDPGPHAAIWLIRATPTKNYGTEPTPHLSIAFPIYIDAVTPSSTNGFSSFALHMCFAPPDWPAGAVVRRVTLNLFSGIVSESPPSSAPQVWHAVFTTPAAPAVESRVILLPPLDLPLHGIYMPAAKKVAITGTLTQGGIPVTGQTVLVEYGPTPDTTSRVLTRTNGQGQITLTLPAVQTIWARAYPSTAPTAYIDSSGCTPPSLAPGGCVTATRLGSTVINAPIRVTVP